MLEKFYLCQCLTFTCVEDHVCNIFLYKVQAMDEVVIFFNQVFQCNI